MKAFLRILQVLKLSWVKLVPDLEVNGQVVNCCFPHLHTGTQPSCPSPPELCSYAPPSWGLFLSLETLTNKRSRLLPTSVLRTVLPAVNKDPIQIIQSSWGFILFRYPREPSLVYLLCHDYLQLYNIIGKDKMNLLKCSSLHIYCFSCMHGKKVKHLGLSECTFSMFLIHTDKRLSRKITCSPFQTEALVS